MNKELKKAINKVFNKKTYRGHPRFYEILEQLKVLHDRKNYQYSCDKDPLSNFTSAGRMVEKLFKPDINVPLATALVYLSKQVDGVVNMVGENKTNTIEALEDKLMDISIYAILCIILNDETKNSSSKG